MLFFCQKLFHKGISSEGYNSVLVFVRHFTYRFRQVPVHLFQALLIAV